MRVVELNCEFFMEVPHWQAVVAVNAQHVLQRASDEKVLLQQAQAFTDFRFVVGI